MSNLLDLKEIVKEVDYGSQEEIVITVEVLAKIFNEIKNFSKFILIKNFPVDLDLYINFLSLFGKPIPQDNFGSIIAEVKQDNNVNFKVPRGHKSNKELAFHNDRCDIIGLLCSSPAESGGATKVVQIENIYSEVKKNRPDLIKILTQDFYFDLRDDKTENSRWYKMPIFMKNDSGLLVRYIRKFIESSQQYSDVPKLSLTQIEALDYLDETLEREEYQVKFQLQRGDLLLINNFSTLHSRTKFIDSPSCRRLLYRVWLANPNIALLPTSFKPFFGENLFSISRGGMRKFLK